MPAFPYDTDLNDRGGRGGRQKRSAGLCAARQGQQGREEADMKKDYKESCMARRADHGPSSFMGAMHGFDGLCGSISMISE